MINVQQITSQLAQMSDPALQQFAQLHKEDPYSFALAISESSRRKSLRSAASTQQSGQTTGTVADEAVGEMSPPAAGLGSVAGQQPLQRFQSGGSTFLMPEITRDPRIRALVEGRDETAAAEEERPIPAFLRNLRAAQQELIWGDRKKLDREGVTWGAPGTAAPPAGLSAAAGVDQGELTREGRRTTPLGQDAATTVSQPVVSGLRDGADAMLPPLRVGDAPPSQLRGAQVYGATRSTAKAPTLDLDFAGMEKSARDRIDGVTVARKSAAEEEAAALAADQAKRGVYGTDREARIKTEQDEIVGKKDQAKQMALLQAGFAILSADPRKGGWAAIGTGALQGLGAYKGDMAELEKRRAALVDKLDQIEDLRRQESVADAKDMRVIKAKIRQAEVSGAEMFAEFGNKLDLDVKPGAKLAVFKELSANYRSDRDNETRMAAAGVQARAGSRNANDEIIRSIQASHPGMTYEQAYGVFAGSKRGTFDDKEAFADYLKSFKPDPFTPGERPMTYPQYRAQFGPVVSDVPNGQPRAR